MNRLQSLLARLSVHASDRAVVYKGEVYTFGDLDTLRRDWRARLASEGIAPGEVVALKADYAPESIALLLALLENRNIAAMAPQAAKDDETYLEDSQASHFFRFEGAGSFFLSHRAPKAAHPLLQSLQDQDEGGLIIFSSGSTGKPKAILHGIETFLAKFDQASKRLCTLTFLIFDHIAGLDTLFYGLATGGALVLPESRDARYIAKLIQDHQVEVLPTSPSFLRLLALSGAWQEFDLSCLKIVTYGSEPMDEGTLQRIQSILPQAKLIQKYGMSELGSPISKSRDDGSLWLKLGGDGFQCQVREGILWIRSRSAMLGYLNAPSPFDEEGWFCTGDAVEADGEWIRILGRSSELIIVGGEKVYPQEVEAAILQVEGISDALVHGQPHPMLGKIVVAKVNYSGDADEKALLKIVRKHCRACLEPFKVPVALAIASEPLFNARNKKQRSGKR